MKSYTTQVPMVIHDHWNTVSVYYRVTRYPFLPISTECDGFCSVTYLYVVLTVPVTSKMRVMHYSHHTVHNFVFLQHTFCSSPTNVWPCTFSSSWSSGSQHLQMIESTRATDEKGQKLQLIESRWEGSEATVDREHRSCIQMRKVSRLGGSGIVGRTSEVIDTNNCVDEQYILNV